MCAELLWGEPMSGSNSLAASFELLSLDLGPNATLAGCMDVCCQFERPHVHGVNRFGLPPVRAPFSAQLPAQFSPTACRVPPPQAPCLGLAFVAPGMGYAAVGAGTGFTDSKCTAYGQNPVLFANGFDAGASEEQWLALADLR